MLLAILGLLAMWVNYKIHRVPIPKREKLADCKSESLSFPLVVNYDAPYNLVLGLPHSSTGLFSFRGVMELRQSTQLVARIPINSDDLTWCNWLEPKPGLGLAGYILNWSRTNSGERLDEILRKGQNYDAHITFSQKPPEDSSLWFTSIGKVGEP